LFDTIIGAMSVGKGSWCRLHDSRDILGLWRSFLSFESYEAL